MFKILKIRKMRREGGEGEGPTLCPCKGRAIEDGTSPLKPLCIIFVIL